MTENTHSIKTRLAQKLKNKQTGHARTKERESDLIT